MILLSNLLTNFGLDHNRYHNGLQVSQEKARSGPNAGTYNLRSSR